MTDPARLLMLLCLATCFNLAALAASKTPEKEILSCSVESFPDSVKSQLKEDLATWKIQQRDDLSYSARERWQAEKPLQCPGIAVGTFEGENSSAYAVLLVPRDRSSVGYKFFVFGPAGDAGSYGRRVVEQSKDPGAENFFIRKIPVGKFFNATSKLKFHVRTLEGILMVDAGESEYEADVYFWADGRYQQQPVDY